MKAPVGLSGLALGTMLRPLLAALGALVCLSATIAPPTHLADDAFNRDPCNARFGFSDMPHCNASDTPASRARALAASLSVAEKASFVETAYQTGNQAAGLARVMATTCFMGAVACQNEAGCQPNSRNTTALPCPITLAATWDRALLRRAADMVSTEVRSLTNGLGTQNGIICWDPVLNTCRDPRWGRCQEGYGEDPFLVGEIARVWIRGIQGSPHARHMKVGTISKHFAAHTGPESPNNEQGVGRMAFDTVVSERALHSHFLSPFKAAAEAGTVGFMCSYNAINGIPACGNRWLLEDIARGSTMSGRGSNRTEVTIQSDCGAVGNIYSQHKAVSSPEEATAMALNAGVNTLCGGGGVAEVVGAGMLTEAVLTKRVEQTLVSHFQLGVYDAPSEVEWKDNSTYNLSRIDSTSHKALAREAAAKAVVLLENRRSTLPAKPSAYGAGKTILVTGPNSGVENRSFCYGDSSAEPSCHGSGMPISMLGTYYAPTPSHISQPIEAVRAAYPAATVLHVPGCDHVWCADPHLAAVSAAAAQADLVLFFGGVSGHWVGGSSQPQWNPDSNSSSGPKGGHPMDIGLATEGVDRWNITLTKGQESLLQAAAKAASKSKPRTARTVVSLIGGFPVTSAWAAENADALLIAGCGGEQGGAGLLDVLIGAVPPAGRLPYTIHRSQADLQDITVYNDLRNQTYRNRQFAPPPLYRFGDGRSYVRFAYSGLSVSPAAPRVCDDLTIEVSVTNPGAVAADEVVQVYSRCPCGSAMQCEAGTCTSAAFSTPPSTALIGFARQAIPADAKPHSVKILIRANTLAGFRETDMASVLRPGQLWLTVGGGQLGSETAGPVLHAKLNVTGAERLLAEC
jgi:beta-glucosidase